AEGVLGVLPLLDPDADPDVALTDPDVALTDPDADMHLPDPAPYPYPYVVLACPGSDVVLAEPGPEPDVFHRARSGTCDGARYPSRDGLRRWALTRGGSRAAGSFASAGSRASPASRPGLAVALVPPGSPGPAACGGGW